MDISNILVVFICLAISTQATRVAYPATDPPGGECELNCQQTGDCACYDTCINDPSSSTGGRWLKEYCDNGTYWSPGTPHGGVCDFWENLDDDTKEKYREDDDCPTEGLPCEWKADPNCDNFYFFLPEGSKNSKDFQRLQCPKSSDGILLFWDQNTKTCRLTCSRAPNPCLVC